MLVEKRIEITQLKKEIDVISDSFLFLKKCALEIQDNITITVNRVINNAISLFWNDYDVKLIFDDKTKIEVKKQGKVYNIFEQEGGGLINILSFCLRIVLFSISDRNKIMILDEPFHFLDNTKINEVEELLKYFCNEYDMQIIMVSHNNFSKGRGVIKEKGISYVVD